MTCFRSAVYPLLLAATVMVVAADNPCRLQKETGPCRASIRQFYYNWVERQCQEFTYGGCGGNDNRFETLEECERACSRMRSPNSMMRSPNSMMRSPNSNCNLPKEIGPCRASIPSFFYDLGTGQCQAFNYGGCGGNANLFATLEECQQRCAVECQEPKQVGPCRAAFPRWFYDRDTGMCEGFTYGGCGGNRNNFQSLQECQDRCMPN